MPSLLELGLITALVMSFAGAGYLSMAEVAIVRLRRSDIIVEAHRHEGRSQRLLELLDELPTVLNTILLLVLLLQVTAATIGGTLANRWLGGFGVTAATVALTMLLFIYAEAIPKTLAVRAPHQTALRVQPVLRVVVPILRPVVNALIRLADLQSPGPGTSPGVLIEEEIRALARESAAAGAISSADAALVDRSFEFNDRRVDEVMVPRDQIGAIAGRRTVSDAAARAISLGHRRLLVLGDDIDDLLGVVRLRDMASVARETPDAQVATVATGILRCRPDYLISRLLGDMQQSGRRLAIVTDPSGGTLGLVTIEDVVAELVGEIADDDPAAS